MVWIPCISHRAEQGRAEHSRAGQSRGRAERGQGEPHERVSKEKTATRMSGRIRGSSRFRQPAAASHQLMHASTELAFDDTASSAQRCCASWQQIKSQHRIMALAWCCAVRWDVPCAPSFRPSAPLWLQSTNLDIAASSDRPAATIPSLIAVHTPSPAEPAPTQSTCSKTPLFF